MESGLEWEERMVGQLEEEPSFVCDDGYLYSLAAGHTEVRRFSVMIGVWGQADHLQYTSVISL